jgi:hypothetical protein
VLVQVVHVRATIHSYLLRALHVRATIHSHLLVIDVMVAYLVRRVHLALPVIVQVVHDQADLVLPAVALVVLVVIVQLAQVVQVVSADLVLPAVALVAKVDNVLVDLVDKVHLLVVQLAQVVQVAVVQVQLAVAAMLLVHSVRVAQSHRRTESQSVLNVKSSTT